MTALSHQHRSTLPHDRAALTDVLATLVGHRYVLTHDGQTRSYRTGFRFGGGQALAVVRPATLVEMWRVARACVDAGAIVIMQASNTGLTGGSTPDGDDYDRDVVIISTRRLNRMHLLDKGKQVVCLPGATLFELEERLKPHRREPHSVIGSSCIGASVFGGICNNSGGALVRRGPAYTELALYGQVGADGQLRLINHLGIELGSDPEAMLERAERGDFKAEDIHYDAGQASDSGYEERVRDIDAATPARFNADPDRLYEAAGSAGHLVLFAVRVDTFPADVDPVVFYVGSNDAADLEQIRRDMLASDLRLPIAAEYMHRDIFKFTHRYGKDTFLAVKYLGSGRLPGLFSFKAKLDRWASRLPFLPAGLSEYVMQAAGALFPEHLPKRLRDYGARFEHHLLLKVSAGQADAVYQLLSTTLADRPADFMRCSVREGDAAFLHRFAAAGSSGRYRALYKRSVENIVALDIALRRDEHDWTDTLAPALQQHISHRLYYGHFFCHVMHQIYVIKKGADVAAIKNTLLQRLDERGARYPAEHNVGHLYKAPAAQSDYFRDLDPTNTLNAGVGQTSKRAHWR